MIVPDLLQLRRAIEASWDENTSYRAVRQIGNPALGQCYPTSWVVQQYYPKMEIVKGRVWNGSQEESHFWNVIDTNGALYHVDLTWQQFPPGSYVRSFEILDRNNLGDGPDTKARCSLLLQRTRANLLGYDILS